MTARPVVTISDESEIIRFQLSVFLRLCLETVQGKLIITSKHKLKAI